MTWPVALQLYYLRCLADIGLRGMTTDIITNALLGNKLRDGIASFLQRSGEDGECSDFRRFFFLSFDLIFFGQRYEIAFRLDKAWKVWLRFLFLKFFCKTVRVEEVVIC